MLRKVNGEAAVMLGGGRAILLQLAHPFVAAGVDDYSNFQSEILPRLYRTVLFMHTLVFESRQDVQQALRQFHTMHKRIQGNLKHRAGHFSTEATYSGNDPEAKLWVFATFVDTGLRAYEMFIRPLTKKELQHYYADSLVLARLLGVPETILPQTAEAFEGYMESMLSSNTLAVTDTARELGHAVLYPQNVGLFPNLSARLLRFTTGGLLTNRFREAYGLTWGKKQDILLNSFSRSLHLFRPIAPAWVWKSPLRGGRLTRFLLWGMGDMRDAKTNRHHVE